MYFPVWSRSHLPSICAIVLIPLSALLVITQDSPSQRSRVNRFHAIEYALREQGKFLLVRIPRKGIRHAEPILGGQVSTKFEEVTHTEFEENCQHFLAAYSAVIVEGDSVCVTDANITRLRCELMQRSAQSGPLRPPAARRSVLAVSTPGKRRKYERSLLGRVWYWLSEIVL